jgi:serine/threonine protein kinase
LIHLRYCLTPESLKWSLRFALFLREATSDDTRTMIGANERPESVLSSALSLTQRRPDTLEHLEFEDHSEVPYIYMNVLGKGQKGTVEKVKHAHTDSVYARKIYKVPPRSRRKRATEEIEFKNEVAITRRLARHRHVVRVVASYSTSDTLAVILEPAADSGDLKTFLAQYSTVVDPRQQASMLTTIQHAYGCLASGLAFMHAHRIRHRDIKPENILIHSGAVFYADFGISRDYSGRADSATEGMPGAFTARYCAPEVQDQGRRTWKSDVFSLGVVFLLLYTAVCNNEIVELAKTRRFYMYVEAILEEIEQWTVDEEVLRCLREMLKEEEAERLSAGQVLSILKENSAKYLCMGCQQEQDESCSHSPSLVEFEDELVPGTATLQTCVETEAVTSFVASDASTTSLFGRNTATAIALIPTNVEPDFSLSHSNQDQNVDPAPLRKVSQSPQPARRDSVFSDPYDLKVSLATISDSQTSTTSWDNTLPVSSLEPPAISQTTYLRTSRVSHSLYRHEMRRTTKQIELSDKECNLYQDCTYDLAVKPLGLGFRLSRRTPYGSILPSLRMSFLFSSRSRTSFTNIFRRYIGIYPIVEYFDTEMSLIQDGTLLDVQQAFATGRIHPFVQTEYGDNLLAVRTHPLSVSTFSQPYIYTSYGSTQPNVHYPSSLFDRSVLT